MHTHSQASQGLQLQDINTSFLDSLVLDYLSAEDFVEVRHAGNNRKSVATCHRSNPPEIKLVVWCMQEEDAEAQEKLLQRLAAHAAYQQLQQGSVSNAIALAARYCPAVLEVRGDVALCSGSPPCLISLYNDYRQQTMHN
jgi:hypothetical protein